MRLFLVMVVLAGCGGSAGAPDAGHDAASDAAESAPPTHVTTRVIDFDDRILVPGSFADRLEVSIAEPAFNAVTDEWSISQGDLVDLEATALRPELIWEVDYPYDFAKTACLQVLSEDLGAAATIRCYSAAPTDLPDHQLDAEGTHLDETTLDRIQQALGGAPLPSQGLVVGQVLDALGNPAAGATVAPSYGSAQYLSADLTSTAGLTETTSSGVFVSTDSPFEGSAGESNVWTASAGGRASEGVVIGGLINDKVTIVVLRLEPAP
jgi:hypothetical protein